MPLLPDCHIHRYFVPGDTNVFTGPSAWRVENPTHLPLVAWRARALLKDSFFSCHYNPYFKHYISNL